MLGHITYNGKILINGNEIDNNLLLFSWMPQESHNMEGSIRLNLLLGNDKANDEEIYSVLKKVKLKDKIDNIGGLDAVLEYQGANFSGGEKQRLSLARALLSKNPILLLDEPSSSMDSKLEQEIYKIIEEIDKMVIVIAHHLNAIPKDGMIFYITKEEGGRLITKKDFLKIMKNKGL